VFENIPNRYQIVNWYWSLREEGSGAKKVLWCDGLQHTTS